MSADALKDLKYALQLGLSIVTRIWDYKAKDWVTSLVMADVNDDGKFEIIACSRDGRVHLLSQEGECQWERIIGTKVWVGTVVASVIANAETGASARIIVGTRDGKVFVLDKDGYTITKDGKQLSYGTDGNAIDSEKEQQASWYDTGYVIRQVFVDPDRPSEILIGSEDRCAYGLDYETGSKLWRCQTNGWVRTVCTGDINGDGQGEILVGSVDRFLYVLNQKGELITRHPMNDPIHTIVATDVDGDKHIEVLATTDGKDLVALNYVAETGCFQEKWRRSLNHRVLSFCVTDIDGDGKQEIVASSEDKHLYILDAQGNIIWRHLQKYRVFSIHPCDIDNDGLPELIIGTEDNCVRAMRIRLKREVDKRIRKAHRRVSKLGPEGLDRLTVDERALLHDVIGMNSRTFVTLKQAQDQLSAGAYYEALLTLLKLEQQKVERIWQRDIEYIRTVCLRHIRGTQAQEIVVGTSTGSISTFNNSGRVIWSTQLDDHIVDVQTGFIDHPREEEIVICSSDHHVYIVSGPKQKHNTYIDDTWMSSICVTAPNLHREPEIIIGSEDKKLYIYRKDLKAPPETIVTEEGVRIVRAHPPSRERSPEIITASLNNRVYAYARHGKRLWTYETHDHIRAICIKDVNSDDSAEILIASEDHNIHVLDNAGHLLWRYYLPHYVLTIDAIEGDNKIFVGCADGYLYVLNKDGDFLWKYQAKDRIQAVRVEDIDDDGQVEIIIGAEDQLEVLRIVNQLKVNDMIIECWEALCRQQPCEHIVDDLLRAPNPDPILQTFALHKLVERRGDTFRDFALLEKLAKEGAIEVRQALVPTLIDFYQLNSQRARALLFQLSTDSEQEVRNALIEHIQKLIEHDWDLSFLYLKRASVNSDRYVRRLVIRALHHLIDSFERPIEHPRPILDLLLTAAKDSESEWIRQEAARTLAHFLNHYIGNIIIYMQLLLTKEIQPKILEHIAYAVTNPGVKYYMNSVIPMLGDIDEDRALELIQKGSKAMEAVEPLNYGKDLHLIYQELVRLLAIQTLAGIANYQCKLNAGQFNAKNKFARIVLDLFGKLSIVSRPLKLYLWRESAQDRVTSLLETSEAIEQMQDYVEQQYSLRLLGEPITNLPDHRVFVLLLGKWRRLVQTQLNQLRGKAELKIELQTKDVRSEERIGILLAVRNNGRGAADALKITLLYNDAFEVAGSNASEIETIPPQEEITAEFILEPHCPVLNLKFEISYNDADKSMQVDSFEECLELRESYQEFSYIPNPYSTGTPAHDSKMVYGRKKDLDFLKDNLTRDARGVIVLYGQRRSGKTTVLLQLANTPILGEHIPVLVDLQRLAYSLTAETFLRRVAYYISQAMKRKNLLSISTPDPNAFKVDPTHTFDVFLDQIEEQLAGRKLILLIDEFEVLEDQVAKGNLGSEIFQYLRNIVQSRQSINFLLSGTHKITEYTRWYRSVFFNIAIHHQLSRLSPQAAEDLIQKPVEGYLEYEALTIRKIHRLTADQPYLIHLMCRALVDYCNERGKTFVTINDVNIVLRDVMLTGQFHFGWLWDQITPEERVVVSAIAEGGKEEGRFLSLVEIEEVYHRYGVRNKREYILESLKTLIEADIIESRPTNGRKNSLDSHKFGIPVGLSRSWLLKEHPLELVRSEMND